MAVELINGRTPEEIKTALELCSMPTNRKNACESCPYHGECMPEGKPDQPGWDALLYIQHLEAERDAALAKVPKWISVKDRLPEKEGGYLVRKVHAYSDKDGYSKIDVCIYCKMRDPEWIGCGNLCKVTHWMPLPEPPEEEG